jgi:hypothetical protein
MALQVRLVDDVGVDDADMPDARGREVERRRGAEAARAEQQDLRVEQLQLSRLADLGDQCVTRVARALLRGEGARRCDVVAVALPVDEPAGERHRPLVAELLQALRRERGALARRAVENDRHRVVGHAAFDPRLEAPTRDVDRTGDVALVPLVVAADVDPGRSLEVLRLAGVDLLDLGLGLLEEFPVGRHCFKKNSSAKRYSR